MRQNHTRLSGLLLTNSNKKVRHSQILLIKIRGNSIIILTIIVKNWDFISPCFRNGAEEMNQKLEQFYRHIKDKKIAVIGIGISNTPVIKLLAEKGAKVTACDRKSKEELGHTATELQRCGVNLKLGCDYLEELEADIILKTPGIRPDIPQLVAAAKRGAVVTSEMEIFFKLAPCRLIAVTGSDGKSTTTSLISEILKAGGYTVHLGGNIGKPLLPEIEQIKEDDICVLELSSFQLMNMTESPDIAVITNVSPNHLDYHRSMEEYTEAKKAIFKGQRCKKLVLNYDNTLTRAMANEFEGEVKFFSFQTKLEEGYYFTDGAICSAGKKVLCRSDLKLPGDHNVENFMAAMAATEKLCGVSAFAKVASEFGGIPHRLELVRMRAGVRYYNDSIASSPTRTRACFASFPQKLILIAGGYDKKIPFDDFGPDILKHVKHLILMGATKDKILTAVEQAKGFRESNILISIVNSMEEAVEKAADSAESGDIVVLSPACASFDMFKNFEQRGDAFKACVRALKE